MQFAREQRASFALVAHAGGEDESSLCKAVAANPFNYWALVALAARKYPGEASRGQLIIPHLIAGNAQHLAHILPTTLQWKQVLRRDVGHLNIHWGNVLAQIRDAYKTASTSSDSEALQLSICAILVSARGPHGEPDASLPRVSRA